MAVTHANSKHYAKMAPKMDRDDHIGVKGHNGDETMAAAMPKAVTAGKSTTPAPTVKSFKKGR